MYKFRLISLLVLVLFMSTACNNSPSDQAEAVVLPVPFSVQAPNSNWDRNEDCEETSITMANAFLSGRTDEELPKDVAQESINTLKAWEEQNIGYNKDTGAAATTAMAKGAFGLEVRQIENYTADDLHQAINDKHPVLLPIDARLLNNPGYAGGGPDYHMVVVRGYEGDAFIVNDPGLSGGNSNKYSFDTINKAAADWNQATQQLEPHRKIALVISKP